jgi:hypothetical protein
MLIINKKYSNLVKGYQRAIELDNQLKNDWEIIYKSEISKAVNENYIDEIKEYEEKLKEWQSKENEKIAEWQSNETTRKNNFDMANKGRIDQICLRNKQQSIERTNWMIAWILSFIVFFWLLIIPGKSHLPIVLFGIISLFTFLLFCFSIAALIVFIVKSSGEKEPLPQFIPTPRPQSQNSITQSRPIEPTKVDQILKSIECPSVLSRWIEEIQYKDGGEEYFRNLAKKYPQAIAGIPGEIRMMQSINGIFDQNQTIVDENGIYILGLRIGNKDDVDGIEIDKRGIWVLESKYYEGNLSYLFGQWKHSVNVRHAAHDCLTGWQEKEYNHTLELDKQWLREFDCVLNLLSDQINTYPWLTKMITGGLVFTHPEVTVDINNCPVQYSIGMDQAIMMQRESEKPELTFERRLEIADVLLDANRKYEPESKSSVQLAEDISKQLEVYLQEQIESLKPSNV